MVARVKCIILITLPQYELRVVNCGKVLVQTSSFEFSSFQLLASIEVLTKNMLIFTEAKLPLSLKTGHRPGTYFVRLPLADGFIAELSEVRSPRAHCLQGVNLLSSVSLSMFLEDGVKGAKHQVAHFRGRHPGAKFNKENVGLNLA